MRLAQHIAAGHLNKNQRYIDSIQLIGINEIISDIKLIHATYLILEVAVKSGSRKIRPWVNEKVISR